MRQAVGLADPERLRALLDTGLLDSPVEETFDRLTRLLAREIGVPTAVVTLVDDQRQFFKSQVGIDEPWASLRGTPLSHSFCQYVVTGDEPLVIEDARTDPRVKGNLAIEDLGVVAYAGAPVRGLDGRPLGSLCAIDNAPRIWKPAELALIQELADIASELIALRTAAVSTRAAVLDLSHQVRTRLAALTLEAWGLHDPAAASVREELGRLSDAVTAALRTMEQTPRGDERLTRVDEALTQVAQRHAGAAREVTVETAPPDAVSVAPADLGAVLDGLVDVLLTEGRGPVTLSATTTGTLVRLQVRDESQGLPDDVVRRVLARADHADADVSASLAERAGAALGGRLVLASTSPTAFELLLPKG
jgi:GAF domain-containing protein